MQGLGKKDTQSFYPLLNYDEELRIWVCRTLYLYTLLQLTVITIPIFQSVELRV